MTVTVATITRETGENTPLMLQALQDIADQGLHACVGDAGSSSAFVKRVRRMGHTVTQPGNGLRGQMEAAFTTAAEHGTHVLYFESDKVEFARSRLMPTIRQYQRRRLDYAVAGRSQRDWNTFPPAQREIERAQCRLMSEALGQRGDWIGGPALLPSTHVAELASSRYHGTNQHGWGVPWFLLGRAWANHLRVGIIRTATGVHPSARNEFNPGYRLFQANAILGSFYEGAGKDYDWRDTTGKRLPYSR